MKISVKRFNEFEIEELYDVLKLRTDIFVVEQDCAYPELDDFDKEAQHVIGWVDNDIAAYTRLLPPETVYTQPSIGRVAIAEKFRRKGLGQKIFDRSVIEIQKSFPGQEIKIQAQTYLEKFYQSFGFITISEPYPDVGVWHVDMIKKSLD